jgi:asparaginyl-tRNA synthetase
VREQRTDILKERMGGMEEVEWYLNLRKYGGAPHVGFGMGFERLVSWVSGIENIRECTAMPRWAGRMLL